MSPITALQNRKQQLTNLLEAFGNVRSLARKYAYELTIVEGKIEKLTIVREPADRLIFSRSNVAKHLNIMPVSIEDIFASGENAIAVVAGTEIEIKKHDALIALAAMRKASSNYGLIVTPIIDNPKQYTVRNDTKDSRYTVTANTNYISCTCPDYQNLKHKLNSKKVACKHVYKLLGHLKYNSLRDYIAGQKTITEKQQTTMTPDRDYPKYPSYDSYKYETYYDHH
ncbi:MAG: SWIM zinc finger family protein [Limnoraphis robusta]